MRGSFRFNLILWNVIVLAISLTIFSFIAGWIGISRLRGEIDQDLLNRAAISRGPMGHGPDGPGPRSPGGPPVLTPPNGPDQRGPKGGPPPPNDPFFELRRPRMFNSTGQPVDRHQRGSATFDQEALDQALQGHSGFSIVDSSGERLRVYTAAIDLPDGKRGAIQVARELRDVDLLQAGQVRTLLFLLPFALVGAAAGAYFLAGRALKPIGDLSRAAAEIAQGNLDQRLAVAGNDEFAHLAATFNHMSVRLQESFDRLNSAYRDLEFAYEKQRQFTADASHEMRTPLARLQLATSAALRNPEADYRKALTTADQAGASLAQLVDQLLVLAKTDSGALPEPLEAIDLRLAASDAILAVESTTGRSIDASFPQDEVLVLADASSMQRVVQNLLLNSIRHTQTGAIGVSLQVEQGYAHLEVRDEGEGIDEEDLPHLFERFYRADKSRTSTSGGTGLGLAICKGIVEAYRGRIDLQSRNGVGTVVKIFLPIFNSS